MKSTIFILISQQFLFIIINLNLVVTSNSIDIQQETGIIELKASNNLGEHSVFMLSFNHIASPIPIITSKSIYLKQKTKQKTYNNKLYAYI
jgi:hypothetical protein